MTNFVTDTITGTNDVTLQSRAGEVGATWTKHPASEATDIIIASNQGKVNGANRALYYASGVPANANYSSSLDLVIVDWAGGSGYYYACTRMDTSADTYYRGGVDATNDLYKIEKVVAGSTTTLASTAASLSNGTVNVELESDGSNHRLLINGSPISFGGQTVIVDSSITAAGKAGFRFYNTGAATAFLLDNISADTLVSVSTATFPFTVPATKKLRVYNWWPSDAGNGTTVSWNVLLDSVSQASGTINQTANGGQWNLITTLTDAAAGAFEYVLSNSGAGGNVVADAVLLDALPENTVFGDWFDGEVGDVAYTAHTPDYNEGGIAHQSSGATVYAAGGLGFSAANDYWRVRAGIYNNYEFVALWNPGGATNRYTMVLNGCEELDANKLPLYCYHVTFRPGANNVQLAHNVNGAFTLLQSKEYPINNTHLYKIRVTRYGGLFIVYATDLTAATPEETLISLVDFTMYDGGWFGGKHATFTNNAGRLAKAYLVSSQTVDVTGLGQITGLTATAVSANRIDLSWSITSNAFKYRITRGGSFLTYVSGTTYSDTGLTDNTNYVYTVEPVDIVSNYDTAITSVNATTFTPYDTTPPAVPAGLSVTDINISIYPYTAVLSWSANDASDNVDFYSIYINNEWLLNTSDLTADVLFESFGDLFTITATSLSGLESDFSSSLGIGVVLNLSGIGSSAEMMTVNAQQITNHACDGCTANFQTPAGDVVVLKAFSLLSDAVFVNCDIKSIVHDSEFDLISDELNIGAENSSVLISKSSAFLAGHAIAKSSIKEFSVIPGIVFVTDDVALNYFVSSVVHGSRSALSVDVSLSTASVSFADVEADFNFSIDELVSGARLPDFVAQVVRSLTLDGLLPAAQLDEIAHSAGVVLSVPAVVSVVSPSMPAVEQLPVLGADAVSVASSMAQVVVLQDGSLAFVPMVADADLAAVTIAQASDAVVDALLAAGVHGDVIASPDGVRVFDVLQGVAVGSMDDITKTQTLSGQSLAAMAVINKALINNQIHITIYSTGIFSITEKTDIQSVH